MCCIRFALFTPKHLHKNRCCTTYTKSLMLISISQYHFDLDNVACVTHCRSHISIDSRSDICWVPFLVYRACGAEMPRHFVPSRCRPCVEPTFMKLGGACAVLQSERRRRRASHTCFRQTPHAGRRIRIRNLVATLFSPSFFLAVGCAESGTAGVRRLLNLARRRTSTPLLPLHSNDGGTQFRLRRG